MTVDEKIQFMVKSGEQAIEIGKDWEKKGDIIWMHRVYGDAPIDFLSATVGKCANASDAKQFLSQFSIRELLRKVSSIQDTLLVEVEAGHVSVDEFSGNYTMLTLSHLCCVLGELDLARRFASRASHPEVLSSSTPFWYDYARGYQCLWEGRPYKKGTFPSLRGLERYWLPYMDLMEAASVGRSVDEALSAIEQSFRKRNADKQIKDDSYQLDGSPYYPARWDFRRDGLLELIRHLRKNS